MRHVLTLTLLAALAACAPAPAPTPEGDQWTDVPSSAPPARPDSPDAHACAARGGEMRPVCMMGTVQCVVTYADAGRPCRDGDDCQGDCRTDIGAVDDVPVVGQCQATSDPCGCFANVEDGRVQAALCVD